MCRVERGPAAISLAARPCGPLLTPLYVVLVWARMSPADDSPRLVYDTTSGGKLTPVDDGAVVAQLAELGLTTYEAKAYVGLTRRDSSTAAQAARLAGVPRQRIYDVLASLVEKGLAVARPGRVVKYAPTAPDIALEGLLERRRRELAALEQSAAEMLQKLKPAYDEGQERTDPLEYIDVLRDRRAINERFEELQRGIKHEILVFTKPPYATPAQENVEGLQVAKSHRARSVYEYSAFDDPAFVEGVRRFVEAGEEARFVPELPLKLVIIDESIVLFGMEDPVGGRAELTLLVIEHPALAKVLKIAFMAVWNDGLTFDEGFDRLVTRRAKTA
jgi:sugar-specific transcriptional regulator TrmB